MPKVKRVEKQIWDVEGFDVTFRHPDGADVRGDKEGMPGYRYERMAKNDFTVADWKAHRFEPNYPGYTVDVLNGDGESVPGQTKLGTVRDSYQED